MKEQRDFSGITHYTQVDVQPGGINIQHVEHLYQADILKQLGIELEAKAKKCTAEPTPLCTPAEREEKLTFFIHPSVDVDQAWQIHDEIARLVARQGIQEICKYLTWLSDDKKVLLPQNAEKAYNELVRLGMPDGEGYSLKTFTKYYKR
jgi:hypothetical protein